MNYVILHYFFVVHLCNIKMSAISIRYQANSNYELDDFINELIKSPKFDELVEKVADRAVSKITNKEASPARQERFKDINKVKNNADAVQPNYRDQSNREYGTEYEKANSYNYVKLRSDGRQKEGKIDTQAVMKDKNKSESENLRLKYKYLMNNAYPLSDTAAEKVNDTEKHHHSSKIEIVDAGNHGHHKRDHSQAHKPRDKHKHSHRPQKAKLDDKRIVKNKAADEIGLKHSNAEENPSNIKEDNQENASNLEERIKENIEKLQTYKSITDESIEEKLVPFQFRAEEENSAQKEPDVKENKVTLVDNQDQAEHKVHTTKKPVIRKEGDKLYIFVKGSDYEEYHEEVAKQKRNKKEKSS